MKLYVLSDLHLEFAPFEPPETDADVVILAGDVNKRLKGLEWIETHFPDRPVIYVAGNHEYYSAALPALTLKLAERSGGTSVHFLEKSSVELNGVRFVGTTLWTDFAAVDDAAFGMQVAEGTMNDFRKIRVSPELRPLRADDLRYLHQESVDYLRQALTVPQLTVVVTHHAPSLSSVPLKRREDPLVGGYASRLDGLILDHQPVLWVHGHTHHAVDYHIGSTRVLSNPRGYPGSPVSGFAPDLCIEIG